MNMNHIYRNACLLLLGAGLLGACAKTADEGANVSNQRYFDAWRAIYYPDAVPTADGIYLIEDKPGTGAVWDKDMSVTFLTYTVRNLDGTVSANTDEGWARQLGTWDQTYYYGPQVTLTGEEASYAGVDALLKGMRQGGTRTAIIPTWMMTYSRYNTVEEYLQHETEVSSFIYTVTFIDQADNLPEYQFEQMRAYSRDRWNVTDTLSTAAVFFASHLRPSSKDMPKDTTVYINYTGRRIYDDQVFDTTIADTAKFYHIYDPSKTYSPVPVTMAEKVAEIKLNSNTVIDGFAHGLAAMHPEEKASFVFGYNLGYGSSGSGNLIPAYAALRFDVEMVPEP